MNKPFTIGLDAGKYTGWALYSLSAKRIVLTVSTDFQGAQRLIEPFDREQVKVVVEIPATFVYDRHNDRQGKPRDKMNVHIGQNRREAILLADAIEALGFEVHRVPPIGAAKWTADQLKRYGQYEARTNPHERDAARLAYEYAGRIIR